MFVADFLVYDEADIQTEGATGIGHDITLLKKRWADSSITESGSQANFV